MTKGNTKEGNQALWHSTSHVMADAVKRIWPDVKLAIGPSIEQGFYYDFDKKEPFTPEDLIKIEKEMQKIIDENLKFIHSEKDRKESEKLLKGEPYKLELLNELKDKKISFYQHGNFIDMCAGPHIDYTKRIKAFKLTKIAGAYWRGDSNNKMLQRIYGISFSSKDEFTTYFKGLEEAEKRDHRILGDKLDLFMIDPLVGLGLVMWKPKGAMLWHVMEDFWYKEHLKNGYELVRTPHIGNRKLWETSGHWGFYNESMYPPMEVGQSLSDAQKGIKTKVKEEYLIKPMNCPFHIMIYKSRPKSYRDLPIRWAEIGTVYRYEKSGELSGLTRVRGFSQDDAHIICTKEQAESELKRVVDFIIFMFKSFGFNDYKVYLSVRDPKSDKYAGTAEGWKFTESVLEKVAKDKKLDYTKDVGGAVFYGPKLDFKIKDCLGREWQCATLQYDFNLPEKFDLSYVSEENKKERPYMLHRALFGSFERFIGVLIENYAGNFPAWLSPVQVKLLTLTDDNIKYAKKVEDKLRESGLRIEADYSSTTVQLKIRNAQLEKVPYTLVIGKKEEDAGTLAVRTRDGKVKYGIKTDDFIKDILKEIEDKK